ncbi:MAG: serine/threonine protein kinase, partial [Planctomycetota bacterium]|nr:serine/threonine protein kinase [Planctomycetota bacterium]
MGTRAHRACATTPGAIHFKCHKEEDVPEAADVGGQHSESGRLAPALDRGVRLGNFEIEEKIGQGGMGAVYRARQVTMDRPVALKILPAKLSKDKSFLDRFLHEARAAGKLSHPNIVTGIDAGEAGGIYYFAMEFVDGSSALQTLKENGPLPEAEVVSIGIQLASALQHATENGLVHRDVKPDNLLIDRKGVVKLADLGIAKAPLSSAGDATDAPNKAIGTPAYMSPEQATARDDVDIRADIYGAGATLYHLLTGRPLFSGAPHDILKAQVYSRAPNPLELRPDASPAMAAVIEKCLAKDRDRRYRDPAELMADLRRIAERKRPAIKLEELAPASIEPTAAAIEKMGVYLSGRPRLPTGKQIPVESDSGTSRAAAGVAPAGADSRKWLIAISGAAAGMLLVFAVAAIWKGGSGDVPERRRAAGAEETGADGRSAPGGSPATGARQGAGMPGTSAAAGTKASAEEGKAAGGEYSRTEAKMAAPRGGAGDSAAAGAGTGDLEAILNSGLDGLARGKERYERALAEASAPGQRAAAAEALKRIEETIRNRAEERLAELDGKAAPLEKAGRLAEAAAVYEAEDGNRLGLVGNSKLRGRLERIRELARTVAEDARKKAGELAGRGMRAEAVETLRKTASLLPKDIAETLKPDIEALLAPPAPESSSAAAAAGATPPGAAGTGATGSSAAAPAAVADPGAPKADAAGPAAAAGSTVAGTTAGSEAGKTATALPSNRDIEADGKAAAEKLMGLFDQCLYAEFRSQYAEAVKTLGAAKSFTDARPALDGMLEACAAGEGRMKRLRMADLEVSRIKVQARRSAETYGKILWTEKSVFEYGRLMGLLGAHSAAFQSFAMVPVNPKPPQQPHWSASNGRYWYELAQVERAAGMLKEAKAPLLAAAENPAAEKWFQDSARELLKTMDQIREKKKRAADIRARRSRGEPIPASEYWELVKLLYDLLYDRLEARAEAEIFVDVYRDSGIVKSGEAPSLLLELVQEFGEHTVTAKMAGEFRAKYPEHWRTKDGSALWWEAEAKYRLANYIDAIELYRRMQKEYP